MGDWIETIIRNILKVLIMESFEEYFVILSELLEGVTDYLTVTPRDSGHIFGSGAVVWNFITTITQTAIMPVAGLLLCYTLTREVLEELTEKNLGTYTATNVVRLTAKITLSLLLTLNALNIVEMVFQIGNAVTNLSVNAINTQLSVNSDAMLTSIADMLEGAEVGTMVNILISIQIAKLIGHIISIGAILIVYGRVFQMIMYTALAPLPFATLGNKDFDISQNYIKNILATAFQGFLIAFILGLYGILLQALITGMDVSEPSRIAGEIYKVCGFGILLVVSLAKTNSITKSIFGAH